MHAMSSECIVLLYAEHYFGHQLYTFNFLLWNFKAFTCLMCIMGVTIVVMYGKGRERMVDDARSKARRKCAIMCQANSAYEHI